MTDPDVTQIRTYPDGPILIRGDFELLDDNGDPIPAGRRTIALCRCGRTGAPPFCDGTHTVLPRPSKCRSAARERGAWTELGAGRGR